MGGLERYTRSPDHLVDLPKNMVEVIILIARKDWKENPAKQVLRNLKRDPEFAEAIREYQGDDSD